MSLSQNAQYSSDLKTKGFDLSAGKTWIYPENYPVREYQYKIVEACLYKNTLVCLPTGLGKTFIAAVVMYNFWRWYPHGKIVFLAPTRPLVTQQIVACHNIMPIPIEESIEVTGSIHPTERKNLWTKKRVFFATPQVFHNDLENDIVPSDLVKCVVIDEAHKSLGKHSYSECIRILYTKNQMFRVLALSATPGNKMDNVQEILQNLLIAHVEFRDENSVDIVPYTNDRTIQTIVVGLGHVLTKYKEKYQRIMNRHSEVLVKYNILSTCKDDISKGQIYYLSKSFQKNGKKSENYRTIMKTFGILTTMCHAFDLLVRDGLRAFYHFYQNHSDKYWMADEDQLYELLEDIEKYLGPFPDVKQLQLGEIPKNVVFGHTKFAELKNVLMKHFESNQDKENDTKAIVFVEYRDSVNEVYVLLLQCQPLIRPQMFVGQAGLKRKQQIEAIQCFKQNRVNVLISTSIGEEGLDVGEVDLIVCFDISQQSPIRLVQRMGRTGRKRDGKIIMLVTDGKEHQTLKSTMARRRSLTKRVLDTNNISSAFYENNPRMIPDIFKPECLKMFLEPQPMKIPNKGRKLTKKGKEPPSDRTKFSMMKYLKGSSEKSTECSNVKATDVKILTNDNDMINFLTICAVKESENEGKVEDKQAILSSCMPNIPLPKNFFNFSIPDNAILDNLQESTLFEYNNKSNLNYNEKGADLNVPQINDHVSKDTKKEANDKRFHIETESIFESLLEDSSSENEVESNAEHKPVKSPNLASASQDLIIGEFEELLNDSSSATNNSEGDPSFQNTKLNELVGVHTESNVSAVKSCDMELPENIGSTGQTTEKIDESLSTGKDMLNLTQALQEVARLNSNSTITKNDDYASEEDMFLDEDILFEIEKQAYANVTKTSIPDRNDQHDRDGSVNLEDKKEISCVETSMEELKVPSDFDVSMSDSFTRAANSTKLLGKDEDKEFKNLIESPYFNKTVNIMKPRSPMTIAKKLSNIKKIMDMNRQQNMSPFHESNRSDKCTLKKNESKLKPVCFSKSDTINSSVTWSSESHDEETPSKKNTADQGWSSNSKQRLKKGRNVFIDDEAEVSCEAGTSDGTSGSDKDLEDFVSYTQNVHDTSDMHAHYLQSIKTPAKNRDGFLFKRPRTLKEDEQIYSQPLSQTDESYVHDSFCVNEEHEILETTTVDELCELERAELELEMRRRKRKRNERSTENSKKKMKRSAKKSERKYSSSSEDELEKLREEVKNKSFVLYQ